MTNDDTYGTYILKVSHLISLAGRICREIRSFASPTSGYIEDTTSELGRMRLLHLSDALEGFDGLGRAAMDNQAHQFRNEIASRASAFAKHAEFFEKDRGRRCHARAQLMREGEQIFKEIERSFTPSN